MGVQAGDRIILVRDYHIGFSTVRKGTQGMVISYDGGFLTQYLTVKFDGWNNKVSLSDSDFSYYCQVI